MPLSEGDIGMFGDVDGLACSSREPFEPWAPGKPVQLSCIPYQTRRLCVKGTGLCYMQHKNYATLL